jgi:trehalose 6-phosphate synthase/phosphatase
MKVFIVSNRTPDIISGGLVTAVFNAVAGVDNVIWLGLKSREDLAIHDENIEGIKKKVEHINVYQILASKDNYSKHYEDFSNRFLWPVNHDLNQYTQIPNQEAMDANYAVNKSLAENIIFNLGNDQTSPIWIHDYHHYCLPKILKDFGCKNPILFFNHTPIATPSVLKKHSFEAFDFYTEIMKSLSAADQIYFQTKKDVINYSAYSGDTEHDFGNLKPYDVLKNQHNKSFGYAPISVDVQKIKETLKNTTPTENAIALNNQLTAEHIFMNFERADYSKGILERLQAFEIFLKNNPDANVQMLVSAEPTRKGIKEYDEYANSVKSLVEKINKDHNNSIVLFNQKLTQSDVYHLMNPSDTTAQKRHLLVTSYTDGMNLTAKEFAVIAKCGALIIHEGVGAANELVSKNQGAIGYSVRSDLSAPIVTAMEKVVTMSGAEIRRRNQFMMRAVEENSIQKWSNFHQKEFVRNNKILSF